MMTLSRALTLLIVLPAILWSQATAAAPLSLLLSGDVTYVHPTLGSPFGILVGQEITVRVDFDDTVGDGEHVVNTANGFHLAFTLGTDPAVYREDDDNCFDVCTGFPSFSTTGNLISNFNYLGALTQGIVYDLSVFRNGNTVLGNLVDWTVFDENFVVYAAGTIDFDGPQIVIPEPASALLLLGGVAGIAVSRRRRRTQA